MNKTDFKALAAKADNEPSSIIPGLYFRPISFDQIDNYESVTAVIMDEDDDETTYSKSKKFLSWFFENVFVDENGDLFEGCETEEGRMELIRQLSPAIMNRVVVEVTEYFGGKQSGNGLEEEQPVS